MELFGRSCYILLSNLRMFFLPVEGGSLAPSRVVREKSGSQDLRQVWVACRNECTASYVDPATFSVRIMRPEESVG